MEKEKIYLISDASKKVEVESHVLRYWEDELKLPVKRTDLGHRYYTEEDITEFREIKKLKEQGLQLKAIRMILKNGKLTRLPDGEGFIGEDMQHLGQGAFFQPWQEGEAKEAGEKMMPAMQAAALPEVPSEREMEEKTKRLEYLMKRLISEAVQESNRKIYEELSETLTKELDYQFRMQEEREDARESRQLQLEEEHYKKLDELLRGRSNQKKQEKMKKEGKRKLFRKKKA